jgi:glucosyl-dolichyl phosphate glucuronosyltransferase
VEGDRGKLGFAQYRTKAAWALPAATVTLCCFSLDRWEMLASAIGSLFAQTHPPDEILVVTDHNRELFDRCRARWPELRVLESAGPPGLSGARNTAVEACATEVIGFLDDDAVATPGWLATLLGAYEDDRVLAAGGAVSPRWTTARPSWFPAEFDWVIGCSHAGMPPVKADVRNVIGASMSFRCSELRKSGGFRTQLGRVGSRPAGCEETEACIRIRHCYPGALVVYEPQAVVYHAVPPGRASLSYFLARCAAEGRSKAIVASLAGPAEGLSAERSYLRRTLPAAIGRNLRGTVRGDLAGILRAGAIAAGAILTGGSYAYAAVDLRRAPLNVPEHRPA